MSGEPQISDLTDTLADAALFGNKVLLESLLENGADPNIPKSNGNCPLHEAAQYGETECASILLAHKATVNASGSTGKTPLHMAVSGVTKQEPGAKHANEEMIHENQMNIVRLLVSHGANLNAVDNEGCTPRDLAMDCDFYECADLIDDLEKLKIKHTEDVLREERLRDLYSACEKGDLSTVKKLLPHIKSALNEFLGNKKENLLMCAAEHGHLPIVEYCLAEGAVAVANQSTNKTALHLACENGHTDVVVALLNHLPALLMIDDSPGETSLHIVARAGYPEIARNLLLVARQTEILKNSDCVSKEGEEDTSPGYLYDHSNTEHEMNEALPEIEVDVMAKSVNESRTPLHDAAIRGNTDVVRLLLDFLRTHSGSSRLSRGPGRGNSSPAFPRASMAGKTGSPNARQSNLDGPGYSNGNVVKQRLEPVPGIDMFTLKGRTAFHEASRHQHYEVMDLLLQAGADINAFMSMDLDPTAQTDLTALVQACLMDQPETVRFLLRHGAKDARLKALSRSLKAKFYHIAGLLLCYNKQVREVAADIAKALSLSSEGSMTFFQVMWNSKSLKFVCKEWLEMVVHELPQPQDRSCAIAQLDISSNSITELPIEIFKLPYLTTLDFSRNEVQAFPCEEGKHNGGWTCSRLSLVEGMRNQLTSLPPYLFNLGELKEINVVTNKITSVPPSVWYAPKLSKLYLAGNLLERFPTPTSSMDESVWESPESPSPFDSFSPTSPASLAVSDSGYRSDSHNASHGVDSMSVEVSGGGGGAGSGREKERRPSVFQLAYGPVNALSNLRTMEHKAHAIQTQAVISRRLESFQDATMEEEELEELEEVALPEDEGTAFLLEVLDLSNNNLVSVPDNLSCLAPKLTKLNISKNKIKSLGHVNDYPLDLEFLDASRNNLHTALAPALTIADLRYHQSCARKQLVASPGHSGTSIGTSIPESSVVGTPTTPPFISKLCSHRTHKNLRKLSTLKLNHNHLIDIQLFRSVSRNPRTSDLSASMDESSSKLRAGTGTGDPYAMMVSSSRLPEHQPKMEAFSKSINFISRAAALTSSKKDIPLTQQDGGKGSGSSHSEGSSSQEGSGPRGAVGGEGAASSPTAIVISPLYPMLATLELSHNQLRNVPSNIHRINTLSSLLLSHNKDIDHLPLELSNLEHLWNLEYEGCPLTNPPKEDLDMYRLASDKLLYMRSLLHDAKPNESMKLMLVGYQRMGKTTLLSRLREVHEKVTPFTTFTQRVTGEEPAKPKKGRADTLSTVGVDVGIWKYRKDLEGDAKSKRKGKTMRSVTFYTWDFGGQEEYYVTHQCFLSSRSLYLVVWNVTKGERGIDNLGPWLHNIQARAPGSPVVIVGTHCDTLKPDTEKERRKAELNHIIYQKYLVGYGPQQLREMGLPKILDVIYVGCPLNGRPEGVAELRCAIYDIAFSLSASAKVGAKTKLLEQPIPASFLKLEERVRHLAVSCKQKNLPPLLKKQTFIEETNDIIANPRELNQAVTFLHENGIMLHYATPALSHLYFVDPQWLCDMLAHIVTVPEVNRFIPRKDSPEAGILRTTVLSHVFKGSIFPQAHRKEYIELLGKFEVALYLDRHRLLVPSMLPTKPSFTIHRFKNVFPRPSLASIIHHSPETPRLFGRSDSHSSQTSRTNSTPSKEKGEWSHPKPSTPTTLAVATHTSEEFYRTGLILRRFYFMTYVPSGFWPRLISRFLASSEFVAIVQRNLGYSKEQVREMAEQLASGECKGSTDLEWAYWKTGIELWYKGLSLLRLTEILPEGSFDGCKPSSSIFDQSETAPFEPSTDARNLTFELSGVWIPVDMNPSRGIEILVPDTVCLSMLQSEVQDNHAATPQPTELTEDSDNVEQCPRYESHWMSAELLSLSADYIDTLLEDWYPGLGAREGGKTMDSIPYVNRVIPCPYCISGAALLEEDMTTQHSPLDFSSSPHSLRPGSSSPGTKRGFKIPKRSKKINRSSHSSSTSSQSSSPGSKAKRSLFLGSNEERRKSSKGAVSSRDDSSPSSPHPEDVPAQTRSTRQGSLLELQGKLDIPVRKLCLPEPELRQDSKFGFMIESCIVAARQSQPMVCPAHQEYPLPIRDLAPDLVFADLPSFYLLNPVCVDKGEYVNHGSFGDIYHGAVYPSITATDDEGREVAIKIDRLDSKKFSVETATKSYIEVRAEVSLLHRLQHPYVIDFIGVVLHPLCFILEWAPGGSLDSVLHKYRKLDARVPPRALQKTAHQVASGLAYLHSQKIVYYDLKSPNILVFQFPSAQDSLAATGCSRAVKNTMSNVYVKIADLGISQILCPGGVMGFKGSPGFMAPEILKYVGTEACTEKLDIYSFAMFLFETISLHFPFEKQNLMHAQIEKLVIEGERPPLQSRELNNPILFLDVMRWCWQQDSTIRPSAAQLEEILTNPSIPYLVDAISLHNSNTITCACVCTLPIEIVPPGDADSSEGSSVLASMSSSHSYMAQGDLQEELWLSTYNGTESEIVVINFKGKAAQSFPICQSKITSMCSVSYSLWLGTEDGELIILDLVSKHSLFRRYLSVRTDQAIMGLYHLVSISRVVVARKDGYILLCNEDIENHKSPDVSNYDNHQNLTVLPVRSVSRFPESLPVMCSTIVPVTLSGHTRWTLWCGTSQEMIMAIDITPSYVSNCQKLYNRSRYDVSSEDCVVSIVTTESGEAGVMRSNVWAFTRPGNVLYCWDTVRERVLNKIDMNEHTADPISFFSVMETQLFFAVETGKVFQLQTEGSKVTSSLELRGHPKDVYKILTLGARTLPRHWLPSIIGRSNVIEYYKDLVDEKEVRNIAASIVGMQTRLVVTVGYGYRGVAGQLVEPLMSPRDSEENFVLLWFLDT